MELAIAELTRQVQQLKLSSETASSMSQGTETGSILNPRPVLKEISELVGAGTRTSMSSASPPSENEKLKEHAPHMMAKTPMHPILGGKYFRLFLQRYTRWSLMVGLETKNEEVRRTWFVAAMTDSVLPIVE